MKYYAIPSYLLYSLIITIIIISGIFYFAIKDSNECLNNPMIYGANKAITSDSGDLVCSCSFSNPSYSPFYFDKDNMEVIRDLIG